MHHRLLRFFIREVKQSIEEVEMMIELAEKYNAPHVKERMQLELEVLKTKLRTLEAGEDIDAKTN